MSARVFSCRHYLQQSHPASTCILLSSSDHSRLSSSERVRRKRLSSTLARRRAARHSALNHGVDGLYTVTDGQWLSNSSVITRLYMSTRSSADMQLSVLRLQQSVDAAKSAAKASWSNRCQVLRDTLRTVLIFFSMHNLKLMTAWSEMIPPTHRSAMTVSVVVMTRSSIWPATWVGSATCWTQSNDCSSWTRHTACGSLFLSIWTLKSPHTTTGHLYVAMHSKTADNSSKNASVITWLPGR